MPLVVDELRALARSCLAGERESHTLQPTALVNEAYIRLIGRRQVAWQCRSHFFVFAAQTMRRILIDHARSRSTAKRYGAALTISLDDLDELAQPVLLDLVDLDEALTALSKFSERESRIVEMRYFGGLTFRQIAVVLEVSEKTVQRDWIVARTWLYQYLRKE